MRTLDVDVRRYAWCHGHAVWWVGLPIAALLEDMKGAVGEGQDGLVHRNARMIGQSCAVVLALVTGWLGGELVDRLGVGVDSGAHVDAPSSLSGRPK